MLVFFSSKAPKAASRRSAASTAAAFGGVGSGKRVNEVLPKYDYKVAMEKNSPQLHLF